MAALPHKSRHPARWRSDAGVAAPIAEGAVAKCEQAHLCHRLCRAWQVGGGGGHVHCFSEHSYQHRYTLMMVYFYSNLTTPITVVIAGGPNTTGPPTRRL